MIGDRLKDILAEKDMSVYELSKKSKISNSYLSELINNKKSNPSLKVIKTLSEALDIESNRLI